MDLAKKRMTITQIGSAAATGGKLWMLSIRIRHIAKILLGVTGMNPNTAERITLRVDGENLVNKLLSLLRKVKEEKKMGRWVHMPPTNFEYNCYKILSVCSEAFAYEKLGIVYMNEWTRESFGIALKHIGRAQVIYKLFGCKDEFSAATYNLASIKTRLKDENFTGPESMLSMKDQDAARQDAALLEKSRKGWYENEIQEYGENAERTIRVGVDYVEDLRNTNSHIEAERLTTKLSASSRQVLGLKHNCTKRADAMLEQCRTRFVVLCSEGKVFQALRYEDDGDTCVIKGPITKPRNIHEEREYRVASEAVVPKFGCFVTCHGLKIVSHLNGKLGEINGITGDVKGAFRVGESRLLVHLEDKSIKPTAAKVENLLIVFDLPIKAQD